MTEIKNDKKLLRERFALLRKQLQSAEKDAAILSHASVLSGASFFVYYSFGTEVDTHALINTLLEAGKTVCLPRVIGRGMAAVRYTAGALEKGAYGIWEPIGMKDTPCEIALVPLLAVDAAGNRLGYGGGYYDRYLRSHPNMLRVGLCYEGQVVPALPAEKTDIPLSAIITENGYRAIRKT